jgi:hypothetical protein
MQTQPSPHYPNPPKDQDCHECKDMDNATQLSINKVRLDNCRLLYDSKGEVAKQEKKFDGENEVFKEKKCMFLHTEENYRRYRNLDICAGTELLQTNDSIKANVNKLKDWNKNLNTLLVDLVKKIKDAKSKFSDLYDTADKLNKSYNDKCNAAQKRAITGRITEGCDQEPKPPIDACKDAGDNIDMLICMPNGLFKDIDFILQSSADVVGIQVFSNIDTLEQLQKDLTDKSQKFETHINTAMKTRKSELDKLQDDLVKSVKSVTQSAVDRNSARSDFEGYYDAVNFMCCPKCECVNINPQKSTDDKNCNDCPPRLKECAQKICDICVVVKTTFCCSDSASSGSSNPPGGSVSNVYRRY